MGRLTGIKAASGFSADRVFHWRFGATSSRASPMKHPFAIPAHLSPNLTRVQAYWRGLLRGEAKIPFWDDARPSDLPDLTDRLFLLDAFHGPERFRFAQVGAEIGGQELEGRFLDETALGRPFEFLRAQSSATLECAAPTCFRVDGGKAYSRLLLPMWGDGRISMILGVVDFA